MVKAATDGAQDWEDTRKRSRTFELCDNVRELNVRERARTCENAREGTRRHEFVREASESARASERAREKEGQKEIDLLVEVAVKPVWYNKNFV